MSYTPITHVSTGDLATAALHNTEIDNIDFVFAAIAPTGTLASYGGSAAPTGWLLCDGTAVNRTTFAGLFAVIGTTYGAGNGTTTFNVPDARGKFLLSKAAAGTGSTLGASGGAIDHTHTTPQKTVIDGSPTVAHSLALDNVGGTLGFYDGVTFYAPPGFAPASMGGTSFGTTADVTGATNPPYLVVQQIIKT